MQCRGEVQRRGAGERCRGEVKGRGADERWSAECKVKERKGAMFAAVKERMDALADAVEEMAVEEEVPCFRVAQSREVGRHVVTTRPVAKGEVVFRCSLSLFVSIKCGSSSQSGASVWGSDTGAR